MRIPSHLNRSQVLARVRVAAAAVAPGALSGCSRMEVAVAGVLWAVGSAVLVVLAAVAWVVYLAGTAEKRREAREARQAAEERELQEVERRALTRQEWAIFEQRIVERFARGELYADESGWLPAETRAALERDGVRLPERPRAPVEQLRERSPLERRWCVEFGRLPRRDDVVWAEVPYSDGATDDDGRGSKDRPVLVLDVFLDDTGVPNFEVVPFTSKVEKYQGRPGYVTVTGDWAGPGSTSVAKAPGFMTLHLEQLSRPGGRLHYTQRLEVLDGFSAIGEGDLGLRLRQMAKPLPR